MARDRKRAKRRRDERARHAPQPMDAPQPLEHPTAEVEEFGAAVATGGEEPAGENLHVEELDEGAAEEETRVTSNGRGGVAVERQPREGFKAVQFLRACWAELQRVQWPDRRHVMQATGVVLGFVIVAGLYLGLIDLGFSKLVEAIL